MIDQESKRCTVRRTHPTVADFEGRRRRLFTRKRGWPLEAGRGKEMNSLLEPPERTTVLLTTWFFLFSLKNIFFCYGNIVNISHHISFRDTTW